MRRGRYSLTLPGAGTTRGRSVSGTRVREEWLRRGRYTLTLPRAGTTRGRSVSGTQGREERLRRGRFELTLPRAGTTRGREHRGRWIAAGQRDMPDREEAVEKTGTIVGERGRQVD
jgi:hypothetical protein